MSQNNPNQPEIPTLTLQPTLTTEPAQPAPAPAPVTTAQAVTVEVAPLSPQEMQVVEEFSKKIDVRDSNMILQYGADAQKKMADFSQTALQNVRTKDLGEVGDMISNLVVELKGFDVDAEEDKGFFGFFKKASNKIASLQARYAKTETNVGQICKVLENHQVQLLRDIAMLDEMYDRNLVNYKELTMYIMAGKKKLEEMRTVTLPQMQERAKASGSMEDAQAANDMANQCDRFEKKLHDLETTRVISIQMAPQIRLVQGNDSLMAEKIQSTLTNTIPLWKSQMVLALGMAHSQQALEAQREVTNLTNELLRKNAEKLHTGTVETARESERGIVDIETLTHTNQELIATLDEVMTIQQEGRQKRRAAEQELGRIEGELKQKLLELRN